MHGRNALLGNVSSSRLEKDRTFAGWKICTDHSLGWEITKVIAGNLLIKGVLLEGARSEFWGVASRVPWGWRDSYGKTGNFSRVGDKSMLKKCTKKLG